MSKIKTTKFKNVFRPNLEPTDATRTWGAAILGEAPVKVRYCDRDCTCAGKYKVKVRDDGDGNVFRQAFHITFAPGGPVRIVMYRKSTKHDLFRAKSLVEKARRGILTNLWEPMGTRDGWKMTSWLHYNPEAPYSPEMRPCSDTDCRMDAHPWDTRGGDYCEEDCEADRIYTDHYRIYLEREPGEKWTVRSFSIATEDEFDGAAGLDVLRRWVNDHAYLQGEADRLNQKLQAVTA